MLNKSDELKDRVESRRLELQAKLKGLKADSRAEASSTRDKVKYKLEELEEHLKDGWDNMTDAVRDKVNRWLDRD